MCLEVVRTRAFAALLSDEVFTDVDLETVQVNFCWFFIPAGREATTDASRVLPSGAFRC